MHPTHPLLIMNIQTTIIKTKNISGNIHQKEWLCDSCHHGHEGCGGVTCSAANTAELDIRINSAEKQWFIDNLIFFIAPP
jgi:hypothetical protein